MKYNMYLHLQLKVLGMQFCSKYDEVRKRNSYNNKTDLKPASSLILSRMSLQ